ncbi:PIN domain-containing protein [Deinococcus ruber]|uniref:PIN domain-containing protein n=1 Tax=Deinococcus ruber TaxID=1848197 RepID=A0A918FFA7_9DEIO|nr:PIN domain-containing protein [Deinococcus ruber]GGR34535.1 PIN domain-containing protein [Deinococcus ruber]
MSNVSSVKALLDANVLYPATLRSLLIDLSLQGLYQAHWTDALQDEWIRNLLLHRPDLDPAKLQRTRVLMDRALDTARITDYEARMPQLQLPDPDDRHVLAAALHGGVDLIVTQNLRDFPTAVLEPLGLQALHPDRFVQNLLETDTTAVLEALRVGRARFRAPPLSVAELLGMLERQGLPMTVSRLREHADALE